MHELNMSPTIGKLAEALAKTQSIMLNSQKDGNNPFFKSTYSTLSSVWDACRKPLSDNGLSVVQVADFIADKPDMVCIETILCHSSGEWIKGRLAVRPVKSDPQSVGSCITYLRRYSLQSIVGIAPEDDDGNEASQPAKPSQTTQKPSQTTQKPSPAASSKPSQTGQKPSRPSTETQSEILIPENVGEKSGESNGKPWTRTFFKHDGAWYSTFDTKLAELLKEASAMASEIEVTYTKGDKGNNIETATLISEPPPPQREPGEDMEEMAF